jgi:uncharacterized protein (DUF1778 family)
MKTKEKARFDARLPLEQKLLLEKAAYLGGYRSLTDFVILTAQEKAKEIVKDSETVLESKKDAEIFFDAITNPPKPSEKLKSALNNYNDYISAQD